MTYEELDRLAKEIGFSYTGVLDVNTIELKQDVRNMCASGKCAKYNTNWACPPACGSIEDCSKIIHAYKRGILVQTVGQLEDALDGEAMVETANRHEINVNKMQEELLKFYPNLLTLGAGPCKRCKSCTYPDNPCRQPEKRHSSMEAFGMVVSEVCMANNIKYYYGPNTIAYTGCFIFE